MYFKNIIAICILNLLLTTLSYGSNFYQQEVEMIRRKQIDSLVSSGLITAEQAAAATRESTSRTPTIGEYTSLIPDLPSAAGTLSEQRQATEQPNYDKRLQSIEDNMEAMYRRAYGEKAPTLQETLAAYAENPAFSPAEQKNMAEAVSKVTAEHNASFEMFDHEGKQRAVSRILGGTSIDTALSTRDWAYLVPKVTVEQNIIHSGSSSEVGQRIVNQIGKRSSINTTFGTRRAGFFDGFYSIARGEGDLTDLFGMLFIPCVVAFVITKRTWLRCVAGGVWCLDLAIDPMYWYFHIGATIICASLVLFVRWLIVTRHRHA